MGFNKGDKVICIKETPSGSVKKDKIYTIKSSGFNYEEWVRLEEASPSYPYENFSAHRFRKLDTEWVEELLQNIKEEFLVEKI